MIKSKVSRSCKQLYSMVRKGQFTFDNVVQRGYVWNKSQKSNLIHSILEDYPIPAVYAKKDEKSFDVLDGKQRINAITSFMADEFALSKIDEVHLDNAGSTFHVSGLKFSQLPAELRDRIESYVIDIEAMDEISDEEVTTLFKKLNNGKPLTPKDRNIANCPDIEKVSQIGEHALFTAIFKKKALEARVQIPVVMKIWSLFYTDNRSFESRVFNALISSINITPDQEAEMDSVFNKALEVFNALTFKQIRKKFSTETHFVSLMPLFRKAVSEDIPSEKLIEFVNEFFNSESETSLSYAYNEACKSGAARPSNVETRINEILNYFNNMEF